MSDQMVMCTCCEIELPRSQMVTRYDLKHGHIERTCPRCVAEQRCWSEYACGCGHDWKAEDLPTICPKCGKAYVDKWWEK